MNMTVLPTSQLTQNAESLLRSLQQALLQETESVWLVGGTLRDLLSGIPPQDFDFAFAQNLTPRVKLWAKQQGGAWFWLDAQRNQSRVLFTQDNLQFDFSPLRAENIEADLRLRDFTVNAMAVMATSLFSKNLILLDPTEGQADLKDGVLRQCNPDVFFDDPLRILKGIRHHAQHGWHIEEQTLRQMSAVAPCLTQIAGERIKLELMQILSAKCAFTALGHLKECRILECLFPDLTTRVPDLGIESFLQRLDQLSRIKTLKDLLEAQIEAGVPRKALLFLAVLLSQYAPVLKAKSALQRIRLSARSQLIVQQLFGSRPRLELFLKNETSRIEALRVESLGKAGIEKLLFALACHTDEASDLPVSAYLSSYLRQLLEGKIADLLNGNEIMAITGLPIGKAIGSWQARIKEAEITGIISDKAAAVRWLEKQFYN